MRSFREHRHRAESLVSGREEQLANFGAGTADVSRAAGLNGDTWAPVVVLAAGPATDEELQRVRPNKPETHSRS